jgi:hypothetical protein
MIGLTSIVIGLYNKAEFIFSPILGGMIGALYSYSDYEDGREHTLQVCLFLLSITIVWMEPSGLK